MAPFYLNAFNFAISAQLFAVTISTCHKSFIIKF